MRVAGTSMACQTFVDLGAVAESGRNPWFLGCHPARVGRHRLQVPESSRTIAELVLHGFGEPGMVLRVAVKLIYQMFTKLLS
jgi:hypothetical protein